MKKIFIFSLSILVFLLLFPKNVNAATTCDKTTNTNPDTCSKINEQSECCDGYICKAGVMGSPNTCQVSAICVNGANPKTCSTVGAQSECCNGFTCTKNALGPNTCKLTTTSCVNGTTDPATCTTVGAQAECCSGSTCTKQSMGPNICVFTATSCVGTTNPKTCNTVGQQSECCNGFTCTKNALGPNTCQSSKQQAPSIPANVPCGDPDSSGNYTCDTGLGFPISTNPQNFVMSIMGVVLSISGGIAVILIIFAGYKLMFSQGNPEKVAEARSQLTAAIVGLLFIIFSLVILEVIGVDILRIPGFYK